MLDLHNIELSNCFSQSFKVRIFTICLVFPNAIKVSFLKTEYQSSLLMFYNFKKIIYLEVKILKLM